MPCVHKVGGSSIRVGLGSGSRITRPKCCQPKSYFQFFPQIIYSTKSLIFNFKKCQIPNFYSPSSSSSPLSGDPFRHLPRHRRPLRLQSCCQVFLHSPLLLPRLLELLRRRSPILAPSPESPTSPAASPAGFFLDSDEDKVVDELLSQAMDSTVLEQVATINCSGFNNSGLPSHLETRFARLKSFPAATVKPSSLSTKSFRSPHPSEVKLTESPVEVSKSDSIDVFSPISKKKSVESKNCGPFPCDGLGISELRKTLELEFGKRGRRRNQIVKCGGGRKGGEIEFQRRKKRFVGRQRKL